MAFRGISGKIPEVTSDHQLLVAGVVESEVGFVSETKGKAFSWYSGFTTGGTDVEVLSLKNTSTNDNLIIDQIIVSADAACIFTLFEVTSGTAGGTSITGKNLNLGLGLSASQIAYGNAAVTGSLSGDNIASVSTVANDNTVIDVKSGLVLGQDSEIAITASANTVVRVTVIGHYKER